MITARKTTPEKSARRFFLKKKWGKAIDEFQKLLRDDESNLPIINLIGDAHFLNNNPEEAFLQYRKALTSYEEEGLFDNAIAISKKILRLNPGDNDIHLKLAELYTDQGFLTDALEHLTTYLNAVGKRLDEKAVRLIYQKIVGTPNNNSHLWDEIVESYQRTNLNDPELNQAIIPGGSSPATTVPSGQPESIPTGHKAIHPDQLSEETTELELQPLGTLSQKTQPPPQSSKTTPEFPKEELPLQDIDLEGTLQTPDDKESSRDTIRSVPHPLSDNYLSNEPECESDPDLKLKYDLEPEPSESEDSAVIDLQLANILREVLPSEEDSDQQNLSVIAESFQDKSEEPAEKEKLAEDSLTEVPEPPLATPPESDSSLISKEPSKETEPESDLTNKTPDRTVSLTDEKHSGMDTIDILPKNVSDRVTAGEDQPLWTLPYEVAEERVPKEAQTEETPLDKIQENQAVESILTGFAGEANSDAKPITTSEEIPTLPTTPSTKDVESTPPPTEIQPETPSIPTIEDIETGNSEQPSLDSDLHSLELSELAEMKRERPEILPSFDGKEHFDMGKVYKEMELWDAAIAELKTSAMDPRWRAKSCIMLADCFRQKGEIVLAISQLKWALSTGEELKEDNDKYNLHYELGLMFEAAGSYPEAKEQYQAVHRWNPTHRGVEKKLMELRKKMPN
jgi:tetratricopeptide (TPR) repeat protein